MPTKHCIHLKIVINMNKFRDKLNENYEQHEDFSALHTLVWNVNMINDVKPTHPVEECAHYTEYVLQVHDVRDQV